MRTRIALFFLLILTLSLSAKEIYPGPTLGWGMALETYLAGGSELDGGAVALGFGLHQLANLNVYTELMASMQYQGSVELAPPLFTPQGRVGYELPFGPMMLRAFLLGGISTDMDKILFPHYGVGLSTGIHLGRGVLVDLIGQVQLRIEQQPSFLLGLRLSHRRNFLLKLPTQEVVLDFPSGYFSPDDDGSNDSLQIGIHANNQDYIRSWEIRIIDNQGEVFFREAGAKLPPQEWEWDGIGENNEIVSSATEYQFQLELQDVLGRRTLIKKDFTVDILVELDGDKYRIRIPTFVFPANSADYEAFSQAEMIQENQWILDQLVHVLGKFPSYRVTIEGHANPVYFNDPQRRQSEESVLEQISIARAQAVRNALVDLGLDPERLEIVGMGGKDLLAPPDDERINWKNRRVDFILERP